VNSYGQIDRLVVAVGAVVAPRVLRKRGMPLGRALGELTLLLLFSGASEAQTVTLEWDANTELDLAGYSVYYGTASGVYSDRIDVGNVTTTTIGGLMVGARAIWRGSSSTIQARYRRSA
jgi:hypothetical protein